MIINKDDAELELTSNNHSEEFGENLVVIGKLLEHSMWDNVDQR